MELERERAAPRQDEEVMSLNADLVD